jgi:hypothetical protein
MSYNVTKTNCDKTPLSHTFLIRKSFGKCTNNENKSGSGQGISDKTRLGPAQTVVQKHGSLTKQNGEHI